MSYHIRNWSEYNAALKARGSLTFWIDEAVLEQWIIPNLSGKPGASDFYSDLAISTMATVKAVYKLGGRQCQGFVESVFELMDIELSVPDHSTLSRRLGQLSVKLPVLPKSGARHVGVDSTGVKVYGEGEWKTRQHGVSKRRTWRKLHLGVDEETGEILAAVATTNNITDAAVLPGIANGIQDECECAGRRIPPGQIALSKSQPMQPMTNASATMRCEGAKQKPRFHRVKEPKSGSMATPNKNGTTATRICVAFAAKWPGESSSGTFANSGVKPGNNRATTIAVHYPKPQGFFRDD